MGNNLVTNLAACMPSTLSVLNGDLSILYYSHIPTIILSFVFGLFVLIKGEKSLLSKIFFALSFLFVSWSILDLFTWLSSNSAIIMFTWSITALVEPLLFIVSLYFVYVFAKKEDISLKYKILIGVLLIPLIAMIPTRFNLSGFNAPDCYSLENNYVSYYKYFIELVASFVIIVFSLVQIKKAERISRRPLIILLVGTILFLFSFFIAVFLGQYLIDSGYIKGYTFEIYGLFGTTIFMGFMGYLIVQFKAFNIKLLKAQALMVTLAILIGALYFYVTETGGRILILINLALAAGFGYMLVKSVKKEVEQKEELEVANKKIKVAYFKLEELDKAKAEFTSLANHQLKHAPTSIKSLLGMFLEGDYGNVPDNQLVALKNINVANERQIRLADDLLQIIKMESNKVQLDFQKQRIEDVCQGVYDNLSATAKERSLKLSYEKPEQALPEVLFDKSKVFEAIFNFVDNAIKYTKEGGVAVKAEVSPSSNYKPQNSDDVDKEPIRGSVIRVTVSDTGSGISKENLGQLFAKFSRKDTAKLNSGGTGLGLYLVKLNIEAHGGRTWAESDGEGKGSRFIMELPIETPREILEQNEAKN